MVALVASKAPRTHMPAPCSPPLTAGAPPILLPTRQAPPKAHV